MKSKTKSLLSHEDIEKLVSIHFGTSCLIGSIKALKGGMFNSAYLIERIREKDEVVLKVSVSPDATLLTYEKDPMQTEVDVYHLITEQTNIPVPRILACDFSKQHISSNYFFMTALKGETMIKVEKKLSKANRESIKKELADYFAQIHQISGDYFGYFTKDEEYQFKSWKDAYLQMIGMILKDGKALGCNLPYSQCEKILREKASYLDQITQPILVNFDLWSGNIFLKKDGNQYVVEGIIDFERAFWGDPYADFSATFLFTKNLSLEENFFKTYNEKSGIQKYLTKEDMIRINLYKMYLLTIMIVETYRYGALLRLIQKSISTIFLKKCLKELKEID